MPSIKSLAKDTAVYGLSSIIGRFLNWCLVPLYVYLFPTDDYGIVSYLYAFTAVVLVILNYGMETGFFRFANKEPDPRKVYTTCLCSVAATSLAFALLICLFIRPVSRAILLPAYPLFVAMLAVTVAIDAFSNIPFAYLRFSNRPFRFASIKLINVALNIALNIFFLLVCPWLQKKAPFAIAWFYPQLGADQFGIGWIFLANLLSSLAVLIMLLPYIPLRNVSFDIALLRRILAYSWPLLILGIAGILSQNMGQMIIPYLFEADEEAARSMVGIYGANIKIAIVMVMFTQAFRYAYEPFIFSHAKETGESKKQAYADAMKYFLIFGLLIFLAVMFYLPILRFFIAPDYWQGLRIVPIMMAAELCFGIFFNLSLWYKLTDRTHWGMTFSLIGFILMLMLNIWIVPMIGIPDGYIGSAWAALISYAIIMILSWIIGRKYYPIKYPLAKMALYTIAAAILYALGMVLQPAGPHPWIAWIWRTLLIIAYILIVVRRERLPIPRIRRLTSKH